MRIHKTSPAKIADVARLAGVSVATVSRALANPDVVSAEARTRVIDAVRAIGYTPNAAARNLRARRTMMVLVVVPDIANPFFAEVLRGIDSKLSTHGYGLIIANLDNSPAKEPRYVELAHARQVDGILLLCGHIPRDPKRSMADAGIPMVAACERIPDVSIPQVEINNRKAACEAVAHLASLGHQRIAYISGPKGNILDQERRAGYLDALNSVGLQADGMLDLEGDFTFRSGAKAATRLLAMARNVQPTAIFAANDEMAIGCIKTLHAAGIRIPQELSVVGFDAVEYADYCEPTLTTVRQPRNEIGAQAALLLVQSMARTGETPDIRVTLDACFSLRESTARIRDSTGACPESDSS